MSSQPPDANDNFLSKMIVFGAFFTPILLGSLFVISKKAARDIDAPATAAEEKERWSGFNVDSVEVPEERRRPAPRQRRDAWDMPKVIGGENYSGDPDSGNRRRNVRDGVRAASDREVAEASGLNFSNPTVARSAGATRGFLSRVAAKVMRYPRVVKAIFDNRFVVEAFMSRDTVLQATASPQALSDYLAKSGAVSRALRDPAVQSAFDNPASMNAFLSSKMMQSLMNTPAGRGLVRSPKTMQQLSMRNPEIGIALANPNVVQALARNASTAGAFGRFSRKR